MRVKQINISGFRSICSTSVDSCGGFNVLIGKNNAGKSNLLLAIDAFFSSINAGAVATLTSEYSSDRDFTKNNEPKNLFAVSLLFALDDEERKTLAEEITHESPQVATAADQLRNAPDLSVEVVFDKRLTGPYVSKLALVGNVAEHTLLEVSHESARQLLDDMLQIQILKNQQIAFEEIPKSSRQMSIPFERLKKEDSDFLRHLMYGRRGTSPDGHSYQRLKELLEGAETYDDFYQAIEREQDIFSAKIHELNAKPLMTPVRTFGGKNPVIPNYVRSLLRKIGSIRVLYLRERRDPIGKAEAKRLLELKVRRGGTEQLRRIQDVVSALLGVEIDAFQADRGNRGEAEAELDVDSFLVQVNGAGIREALRLILDYEFEQPHILLVEEPEIHLHPALENSMMRYLKACGNNSQVFITTHSTNFLDTAEFSNVYLVSRTPETICNRLSLDDVEAKIPQELGIRLSSLFMFDRLAFVEGPSDEGVLREFASTLAINLANASVGFVPMGGVRNLAYFAAESTLDFLTKRQVKMWFVIDRDEREDLELAAIASRLGDRANLVPLKKRELENFLIVPEALCKFVALKQNLAGDLSAAPTIADMNAALEECADDLKAVAVERRVIKALCAGQFPDRRRIQENPDGKLIGERIRDEFSGMNKRIAELDTKIDDVTSNAESEVERDWASSKLDIVPGDMLIDAVCKRFGVRFRKERDCSRLASLITSTDINAEIEKLLQDLVAE